MSGFVARRMSVANQRRRLLLTGLATLTLAPVARAHVRECRQLAFVHTHTGEQLTTSYFDRGEYQGSELARVNYLLRDFRNGEVHPISTDVLDILYDLQRSISGDVLPFHVISGYRSPQTNAELRRHSHGVAEHSLHIQGRAIDVRLPGVSTSRLHELALGLGRGGVGYYRSADFVHVDNGRVRYW
jgi:uncharacterized protein YcbK (DUF882 family)